MTIPAELQATARQIRAQQAPDATFHQAAAKLLDQIALTTPHNMIETQAGLLVRLALDLARAYTNPASAATELRRHLVREHAVMGQLSYEQALATHRRDHAGRYAATLRHDQPAHLHTWVGAAVEPAKAVAR